MFERSSIIKFQWVLAFYLTMFVFVAFQATWLADPDCYWHVVMGREIWQTASLPTVDRFSYTANGDPWIAKEWLSQLIFYGAYEALGWFGVSLISCITLTFALTYIFWRLLDIVKWTIAVGIVWLMIPFYSLSMIARPQVFFFLCFAIYIMEIEAALRQQRRPALWLLPLTVLWTNLHASFPVTIVLLWFGMVEAVFSSAASNRLKVAGQWFLMIVLTGLSFGLTPYGYDPLAISTQIVDADLSRYILEWRPIDWNYYRSTTAEALILGGWLAFQTLGSSAVIMRNWAQWPRLIPVWVTAWMTFRHIRFCTLSTTIAGVMMAKPFADRFPRFKAQAFSHSNRALVFSSIIVWSLCILTPLSVVFFDRKPVSGITPEAALNYAEASGVKGNVYNSYAFGGYLIYRGVPTLIDGRTELYLNGLIEKILDPIIGKDYAAFEAMLNEFNVQWALVKSDTGEEEFFDKMQNWTFVYKDKVAVVYKKKNPNG